MSESAPLESFVRCFKKVSDPRSKHGVSHPFPSILAVVLLGLPANVSTPTEIARRAKIHYTQLKRFIRFKKTGTPGRATISRTLRQLSLDDLQTAFACFLNDILDDSPIAAAVDGKAAKQMKDENGEAIQEYNRDYLVQIKDNQEKTLEQMKLVFEDAPQQPPSDQKVSKKRAPCRFAACG